MHHARCVCLDHFNVCPQATTPEPLKIKLERPGAVLPMRATEEAAGYDLFVVEETVIPAKGQGMVSTGVSIGILEGHYGQVKPRSGLVLKKMVTTDAGVIDRDY